MLAEERSLKERSKTSEKISKLFSYTSVLSSHGLWLVGLQTEEVEAQANLSHSAPSAPKMTTACLDVVVQWIGVAAAMRSTTVGRQMCMVLIWTTSDRWHSLCPASSSRSVCVRVVEGVWIGVLDIFQVVCRKLFHERSQHVWHSMQGYSWDCGNRSSSAFPSHAQIVSPVPRMKTAVFLSAAANPHSFFWSSASKNRSKYILF